MFELVTKWLEDEKKVFRCKNFIAYSETKYEDNLYYAHPPMKVGFGAHMFFHKGWPFFLSRNEKELNNSKETKETLFITTFGVGNGRIQKMLKDVMPKPATRTQTTIYEREGDYWRASHRVLKRNLDSVALPDKTLNTLKTHVTQFLNSKAWYKEYEIPYRTGIILEGPPGTGKTTTSLSICGEFDCDLFIINLSLASDSSLAKMFRGIPDKAVVLIEDIDSYKVATSREPVAQKKEGVPFPDVGAPGSTTMTKEESAGLFELGSLSGLLNAIDGVSSSEDRILVATTNHLEKLDKALIRPGRFELILKIDNMCNEVARKMFAKFYPTFEVPDSFIVRPGVSPAEFQCMAIANKENPKALLDFCSEKSESITREAAV
jgi:chaperone BCS1